MKIQNSHYEICSIIQIWEGPQTYNSFNLKMRRTIRRSGPHTLGPAVSFKIGKDHKLGLVLISRRGEP